MIRFRCPSCDSLMEVDESFAGRSARCPTCGTEMKIPTAEETRVAEAIEPTPSSGVATVRVGGETIEVVPPIDPMAVVGVALLGLSGAAVVAIGLTRIARYPWAVGLTLGAGIALLATLLGMSAYTNIRRSRGRRRGKGLALAATFGGAALTVGLGAAAAAGWILAVALRPTCEENLAHIYKALRAYAEDHDGQLLPKSLGVLVTEGYLESGKYLTCPAFRGVQPGRPTYVMHIGRPPINVNDPVFPPDLVIVSDGAPYHVHEDGKVRALLLGGEVKLVPSKRWERFLSDQRQLRSDIEKTYRERRGDEEPGGEP